MKGILTAVAGLTLGMLVVAAPADAQRRTTQTRTGPVFGVAAGLSQPTGDLGDVADLGFNVTGTLDIAPQAIPFPLRFDVMFNRWGGDGFDGSIRSLAAMANAVFNIPTQSGGLNPYVLGGLGIYNNAVSVDEGDDPDSETDLGINLGGGFRFPLSGFDTYVEARYHNVFGGDENDASFLPIVFGLRF
jgi:hypothetical protein